VTTTVEAVRIGVRFFAAKMMPNANHGRLGVNRLITLSSDDESDSSTFDDPGLLAADPVGGKERAKPEGAS
jgi:hypothetical protein